MFFLSSLLFPSPAAAKAASVKPTTQIKVLEKPITVYLTRLTITTTKSQAREAIEHDNYKFYDPETLAFLMVYSQNWSMNDWTCLRMLWQKESHFNPKAKNKHSGAYGIAQFLPSTWDNYKVVKTSDPKLQIQYGLRYIVKRYSDAKDPYGACNAWAFSEENNWY